MECDRVAPLVSPFLDGELGSADRAGVEAHLAGCKTCRGAIEAERAFSSYIRSEAPRHAAPPALRARVMAAVAAESLGRDRPRNREWARLAAAALIGAVIASGTTWQIATVEQQAVAADDAIASHVRSLMTGHMTDVASSDQHTVKPWFNGRIELSPPVADLAGDGFPLVGGRVDYVEGRPAAALVYRHRQHVITLFVTAERGRESAAPTLAARQGFNVVSWRDSGMAFRAVSDLNAAELRQFEELVRAASR
jgi:anti-sigma factor (TIGR02949 family)